MDKLTPEQLVALKEQSKKGVYGEYKIAYASDIPALLAHIAALEAENARYKEALWEYADHNNWITTHGCENCYDANDPNDWWQVDGDGWTVAEKALKGDSNQ